MASREEIQIILDAQLKNSQKTIEAVKKLEKNIKGADKSIKEAEQSTKFFSTTLGKIAGAVGLGYTINSVKNFSASIIKSRGEMEQYEIAFEVMLGSAEKAGKLLEKITEFAEKTPFELNGLVKSSKELLAFGVEADKIIPTLETLGNIASGTGVDISRLTFVFGQVKTAGKLFAQDLNQFTQAGVPLISALAKEMNIAEEEVKKFGSEGKIAFEDVERALTTLGNTKFANLMARQNNTVLGQFSNLQDVIGKFTRSLGKPLEGVVKKTTQSLIGFFERLIKTVEENEDAIREWAEGFMEGVSTTLDVLKRFSGYVVDFFSNTWGQVLAGALVSWRIFATGVEMSAGTVIKTISAMAMAMAYLGNRVENSVDNTFKQITSVAGALKNVYNDLKSSLGGELGFNVENKTTTTTDEVSTKTTKEETGEDEKAKEKKLKDDLLAIDKKYNTKKLNQQAESVEKQNELNQLASWGYYDEAEKKVEAKELELNSLKEANDLELEQQKEKLNLLREVKGEDNELVLEQEAEFRLMKAEQQAEFDELEAEYKAEKDAQEEERRKKEAHLRSRAHFQETKDKNKQLLINQWRENKAFAFADDMTRQFASLAESKNKKLKAIGKAAAIAQIGIDTAAGAMSLFTSITKIYGAFLGPAVVPVALAAAGLVVAQGAEQIATVNSYAVGSPNIEQDQLATIHKGEIIVPKTFSDGLRDGDLMLGNAKSLDNNQTDEQRGVINIITNFEGANFYGVADNEEMIKQISEAISENIADGLIQPFPTNQI